MNKEGNLNNLYETFENILNNTGNIGNAIKINRKKLKINQKTLAKKIGIANTYLSDIENNRCNPSLQTLIKILKGLYQ